MLEATEYVPMWAIFAFAFALRLRLGLRLTLRLRLGLGLGKLLGKKRMVIPT